MDDQRLGASLRAVRLRRQRRQSDVAAAARVGQTTVSRIERGHLETLSLAALRRVAAVLDVRIEVRAGWRGGDLDRLLNARHSAMHEAMARRLARLPGWTSTPEVSFSRNGERGVIDLLAWHPAQGALLVVELKTEIVDVQEMIGTLDRKRRLSRWIAADRGWDAAHVSAWLVLAESRSNRRRASVHRAVLRSAYPIDGRSLKGWLVNPDRPVRALTFLTASHPGAVRTTLHSTKRVRERAVGEPGRRQERVRSSPSTSGRVPGTEARADT